MCVCVHFCGGSFRGKMKVFCFLEVELQVAMIPPDKVLGTELWASV